MKYIWIALTAGLFLLTGCVQTGPSMETVANIGDEYMQAMQSRDLDKVFSYYADDFFTVKPEEEWRDYLEEVNATLGEMQSYRLVAKTKDTRFSGIFYILQYRTKYANESAKETLILVEPVDTKELKIFGHKIDSKGLAG